MKLKIADNAKTFVYELNAKGANKLYFNIQPGFDDNGERTAEDELAKAATLLTAAPELLKALEDAQQALAHTLSVTRGMVESSTRIAMEFAESKALAAIAKAKGV